MASVRIILRKKIKQDGTFPLALRITSNRKSTYLHLGYSIVKSQWDALKQQVKKSHPYSNRLNNFLLKKLSDINSKILQLTSEGQEISIEILKKQLHPKQTNTSFFSIAEAYLNNLKVSGKYSRYNSDKSRLKQFREFLSNEDVEFNSITINLLNEYQAHLSGHRKQSKRSIMNQLLIIRTIFNIAITQGIIDSKYYPFGKNKIKIKFPMSSKIGLTNEEVKLLENFSNSNYPNLIHAKNLWLISFYFAGIRISDVLRLRWSDIKDGRLYYSMGKNQKTGSLKILQKANSILNKYHQNNDNNSDLIFPDLQGIDLKDNFMVQRKIAFANRSINKSLKKIANLINLNKNLSMHIARHTFGNISGDQISIQLLQKLYRHTSVTTTIGYQANFIHKDTDEALEAVIDG